MYSEAYRGLPAELRVTIWEVILRESFSSKIVVPRRSSLENGQGDASQSIEAQQPHQQSAASQAKKPTRNGTAVLQLDRTTRCEALDCLPKGTVLDLSNLKESCDLAPFLDNVPAWLPGTTSTLIIDRSIVTRRFTGRVPCGSQADSQRLDLLIDRMIPLDRLIFAIDACRWNDIMLPHQKRQKPEVYGRNLALLWSTEDTAMAVGRIGGGGVREVKLFINQPRFTPDYFYDCFVDDLDCGEQIEIEKIVTPSVGRQRRRNGSVTFNVSEDLRYDFLINFKGARFTVVTLTNC